MAKNKKNFPYRVDKEIALLLCRAQNASDGGKYLHHADRRSLAGKDFCNGYAVKDDFIFKAVSLIASKRSSFSYYIEYSGEDWCAAPILIYFNFKIDGERFQVSFHSRDWSLWENAPGFREVSHRVRWEPKRTSYQTCLRLIKELRLQYGMVYHPDSK